MSLPPPPKIYKCLYLPRQQSVPYGRTWKVTSRPAYARAAGENKRIILYRTVTYCNTTQSPTMILSEACLCECCCDCLCDHLCDFVVISCEIDERQEEFWKRPKILSLHTMVSSGARFWSSSTSVAATWGVTVLVENTVVIFLVISVPLTAHTVFAVIDTFL